MWVLEHYILIYYGLKSGVILGRSNSYSGPLQVVKLKRVAQTQNLYTTNISGVIQ